MCTVYGGARTFEGTADDRLLGTMMNFPLDSDGQRALLQRAVDNGIWPNVVAYSILAKQLMIEGDAVAARALVNVEMKEAGLIM